MADDTTCGRGDEVDDDDPHCKQVFDLNWSPDGTVLAAGIE